MRYEFRGQTELEGGEVQLSFEYNIIRLGVAANGETLRVSETPWLDPFLAPTSRENDEYVRLHGKWVLVDVSREPQFYQLIGRSISEAAPLTNRFGRLIGVQLVAGMTVFNAYVQSDELHVSWGSDITPLWGDECRDISGSSL